AGRARASESGRLGWTASPGPVLATGDRVQRRRFRAGAGPAHNRLTVYGKDEMTVCRLLGLALLSVAVPACGQSPAPSPAASPAASVALDSVAIRASATITPEDMYARISFLAADSLGGRDTPSAGLETAAAYLAAEHTRFGL